MVELELKPTFEEKLASFAIAFVPELVSNICALAEEAKENPVIVHLLDEWYINSVRSESAYKSAILEALNNKETSFTESTMTRIYKGKAFSVRDILQEYFMNNGFKK